MRWNLGAQPSRKSEGRLVPPGSVRYTNSIDGSTVEADLEQPLPSVKQAELAQVPAAPPVIAAPVAETVRAPAKAQPVVQTPPTVRVALAPSAEVTKARSGWVIQLGATDDETKARSLLDKARSANPKVLADAAAFTEKVEKGEATLFRARFAGFESKDADAACKALKRSGFSCFAQKI